MAEVMDLDASSGVKRKAEDDLSPVPPPRRIQVRCLYRTQICLMVVDN